MAGNGMVPTAEQLQDLLLESPGFTEFLLGLTTISASLLGGEDPMLCAITVERGAGPATVASSTDAARRLDEMQYEFDEGPCLSAVRGQHEVLIPDLHADERWRSYARVVAGEGIRSVLAVPIGAEPPARAALNCYSKVPGSFDESLVAAVRQHAGSMSPILRLALRIHLPEPYPEHLRSALRSRAVVDAAIALIMVQNRCGRDQAMGILQLASRDSTRRLHDIAADILAHSGQPLVAEPGSGGRGGLDEGKDTQPR
ncbi:Response regulator with putative antiterminator output domain [Arthrobacter sp. 49Tsu3.1M3]|uniref:GAF and ANTAR domain-containing protein n=1 Tax=Arthrobacter sp. 49Tsu3.1M3 TaxID=1279029 RepID=UPI0009A645E9|nr:GAF and ANTAR domain-containing protein [Arthrobacter sp. 49Tsu3.1M3]SKC10121.1 Response regulator with putative antiterminator output domain [Arthrobacter sp. 49Tsu3.1M3]